MCLQKVVTCSLNFFKFFVRSLKEEKYAEDHNITERTTNRLVDRDTNPTLTIKRKQTQRKVGMVIWRAIAPITRCERRIRVL